jgi:hypothetical protein
MGFWDRLNAALNRFFSAFDGITDGIRRAADKALDATHRFTEQLGRFVRMALEVLVRSAWHLVKDAVRIMWSLSKMAMVVLTGAFLIGFGWEILRYKVVLALGILAWALIVAGGTILVLMVLAIGASLGSARKEEVATTRASSGYQWLWFVMLNMVFVSIVIVPSTTTPSYEWRSSPQHQVHKAWRVLNDIYKESAKPHTVEAPARSSGRDTIR